MGAIGLRDAATGDPFTVDTRFHVGSLTKAALATGLLDLAADGRLDLDAPAERYLPGVTFENPWAASHAVTVRHLLDHTAGLNDAHMWQIFSMRAEPDAPLAAAFPQPDMQLKVRSQPGARFSYSNMGYTLLGMIVETVVDDRYEHWLDEHMLARLDMLDSTFQFTTQQGEGADEKLAWGHVDDGTRYAAQPMFLRPAGQLTTTAADLARFAGHLMTAGPMAGEGSGGETGNMLRGRPSTTDAARAGLVAGYALGLGRRDRHGVVGYCHGGNTVGFRAMLCVFPADQKAFAYAANTDSETADYGRIDHALIEALGIAPAPTPASADPADDVTAWPGWYTLSPNRFQSFAYLDTVFGATSVRAEGSSLVLSSLGAEPRRLRPVGGRIYSAADRATSSHVLLRGDEGEYLISDGFNTFEKVPAVFLWAHWSSASLGVAGLLWLLLAGTVQLIRDWRGLARHPVAPAFGSIAALLVPVPLFAAQPFMALGDVTAASLALATATVLLPAGAIWTVTRSFRTRRASVANRVHGVAAVFVLQWCGVLAAAGLLPFRLWA